MALSINGVCCERNFKEKFHLKVSIMYVLMFGFRIGGYIDVLIIIQSQVEKGRVCVKGTKGPSLVYLGLRL